MQNEAYHEPRVKEIPLWVTTQKQAHCELECRTKLIMSHNIKEVFIVSYNTKASLLRVRIQNEAYHEPRAKEVLLWVTTQKQGHCESECRTKFILSHFIKGVFIVSYNTKANSLWVRMQNEAYHEPQHKRSFYFALQHKSKLIASENA